MGTFRNKVSNFKFDIFYAYYFLTNYSLTIKHIIIIKLITTLGMFISIFLLHKLLFFYNSNNIYYIGGAKDNKKFKKLYLNNIKSNKMSATSNYQSHLHTSLYTCSFVTLPHFSDLKFHFSTMYDCRSYFDFFKIYFSMYTIIIFLLIIIQITFITILNHLI